MHRALEHYPGARDNSMGHRHWRDIADANGDLDAVQEGLQAMVEEELAWLAARWPTALPAPVVHADLFPANVLLLGVRVTGLIDFYSIRRAACRDRVCQLG